MTTAPIFTRFNSLQTGKCISREFFIEDGPSPELRFNSLQTGKCISSSGTDTSFVDADLVSIPFKRESVSQEFPQQQSRSFSQFCFNSLQTGKCISSGVSHKYGGGQQWYCFNSLQTGKCISSRSKYHAEVGIGMFQFPSNGKVYLKRMMRLTHLTCVWVSIPFKRESVSQDVSVWADRQHCLSFNSLQTGKCISRMMVASMKHA